MKVKVNDTVVVTTGKDKGKKGKILKTLKNKNRVVVEKVNMRTKHIKATTQRPGERITYEAALNSSNVMVICPNCSKAARVGYKKTDKGKKLRICKKCNESL
ncbi:50S ribosomal protein L24 [Candidatus Peregrinibacteria bacterium]|nr:50S ribosomal protein L24 [Candidatus Peregrinibacteria bacterium]